MVRTLRTRAQKDQSTILIPGTTAAEPWELWATGVETRCLQMPKSLQEPAGKPRTTLALPVAQVIALPLWLQETRVSEFRAMIELQIEANGLQGRGHEAIFDWSIIAQEAKRTLVLAGVLSWILPTEIETAPFANYDLSARCWPLPPDALLFWLEQDHLVMAATRGGRLTYFHALAEAVFTTRVLQDITCILAALRMQDIISQPMEAILWTDHVLKGTENLSAVVGVPVQQDTRPKPRAPDESWALTPSRIGAATRDRGVRRRRTRALVVLTFLAVGVLLALALRFFLTAREVEDLKHWQVIHAPDLALVHETAAAWKDLQPALNPQTYPLEVLLHVSEALPDQQVHLTLFDLEGDHLLIRAEAKNLTAGFAFFDGLKARPQLASYTWEMSQPHLMGNDVTQLQIEGTYASHD